MLADEYLELIRYTQFDKIECSYTLILCYKECSFSVECTTTHSLTLVNYVGSFKTRAIVKPGKSEPLETVENF